MFSCKVLVTIETTENLQESGYFFMLCNNTQLHCHWTWYNLFLKDERKLVIIDNLLPWPLDFRLLHFTLKLLLKGTILIWQQFFSDLQQKKQWTNQDLSFISGVLGPEFEQNEMVNYPYFPKMLPPSSKIDENNYITTCILFLCVLEP